MSEPFKKGTVVKVGPQPRTYGIRLENGAIYTRNRFFICLDRTQEQDEMARTVEDLYPSEDSLEEERKSRDLADPKALEKQVSPTVTQNKQQKETRSGRIVRRPIRYQ